MRKWLMMAVLVGLLAAPVLAQFRPGGGGGAFGGGNLLANKSVQEELKLTDAQKEKIAEVAKKQREAFGEAFKDKESLKDKEKRREIFEKLNKESETAYSKVKEDLSADQKKRLQQIEVQAAGLRAFSRDDVKKALKLSDKQEADIKELAEETTKDVTELMKDARGKDKEKAQEARKKAEKVRKEAMDRISSKVLNDDQRKAFKEMTGTPFEIRFEGFGPGGGKEKGGKKGRKDTEKKDA